MPFGFRKPSIRKSIAARTSVKRAIRNSLGLHAPRGYGWLTNPRKAAYNRVYNRTSRSCCSLFVVPILTLHLILFLLIVAITIKSLEG